MNPRIPFIPEEIVVHLGAPNEKAKNITVSFPEYIKNVASSEIYPSWPLDAIKANILAQISFALNRVYNEWYPSKGYDFDITNQPAYDQAFVEDQQFFENISQIVDDLFNDYIVREGQVQPLYAQYCDGRYTTCDGLSQWGSLTQAQSGKSPLEILKYYYGDDIKIVYNAPVDINQMSYPGFEVELGTAGNMVKILKTQLNRIRNNYPAIPAITNENEYFTLETEEAVKKFQNIFNLPETGIVDKATWYEIKYIYNSVKRIADLYSEGLTLEEVTLPFGTVLKEGSSGQYIRTLNYLIRTIAFFDDDIPLLELTDVYNQNTKNMVEAFQQKYNLPVTGEVNNETWITLKNVYRQTINSVPREYFIYIDEFYPGRFLSRGMTGEDITRLQNFLLTICRNKGNIPGVVVNGIFDNLTEQSVRKIQKDNNLLVNGIVSPITWDTIVNLSKS